MSTSIADAWALCRAIGSIRSGSLLGCGDDIACQGPALVEASVESTDALQRRTTTTYVSAVGVAGANILSATTRVSGLRDVILPLTGPRATGGRATVAIGAADPSYPTVFTAALCRAASPALWIATSLPEALGAAVDSPLLQQCTTADAAATCFMLFYAKEPPRASLSDLLWKEKQAGKGLPGEVSSRVMGEGFTPEQRRTRLCVVRGLDGSVPASVQELLEPTFTESCAVIATPTAVADGVVFLGYPEIPTGFLHCAAARPNRQFFVAVSKDGTAAGAVAELRLAPCVRSLTAFTDGTGTRIAYFAFPHAADRAAHPHMTCASLCVARITSAGTVTENTTVVPVVDAPASTDDFPGLFPAAGSGDVLWDVSGSILILQSVRRSAQVLYIVAAAGGAPTLLSSAEGCWTLLDRAPLGQGTAVLASYSSVASPPGLKFRRSLDADAVWLTLDLQPAPAHGLACQSLTVPLSTTCFGEATLHVPASGYGACCVFMHGGPHACDVNQYSRLFHLLLLRRFAILSINYGGSIGFGRAGVEALYGCAGEADVRDCVTAVRDAIAATHVRADVPLCVQGGSHGGFLTLHLIAAEPSLFAAAAVRNPVTNIASMRHTTDIGDWCEAMTRGGAAAMRQASPIAGVHRVRTPTLMAIGTKDQRVPAFQGREWLNALRESDPDVPTALLEFPDCGHALDSPAAEAEFAFASCTFFEKHCFPKQSA